MNCRPPAASWIIPQKFKHHGYRVWPNCLLNNLLFSYWGWIYAFCTCSQPMWQQKHIVKSCSYLWRSWKSTATLQRPVASRYANFYLKPKGSAQLWKSSEQNIGTGTILHLSQGACDSVQSKQRGKHLKSYINTTTSSTGFALFYFGCV